MNQIEMNGYKRITKAAARKLWSDTAVSLALVPCLQVPGHMMGTTVHPSNEAREEWTLDRYTQNFESYNCASARDVGRYAAFYVELKQPKEAR